MKRSALITCGVYLYDKINKKILICHATNASWKTWTIPKGLKDAGEECYSAAVRELYEETGIDITKLEISRFELPPVKYEKQNKILESFLIITSTSMKDHKFICRSMVGDQFPEVDKWAWVEIDLIKIKLHESQQKNYSKLVELINENS
jgi:8-oxo-dGTP pyrophosphatase MutT (NUDIX family)